MRNKQDGSYDTATILLTNAELGRDYNPDAEEPAQRSGYISGNCSVLDSQDNYITLIVDIEIQKRGNEPYWSYGDDYLEYIDPSNENLETTMISCTFYEESSKFEIEYSITGSHSASFIGAKWKDGLSGEIISFQESCDCHRESPPVVRVTKNDCVILIDTV